MLEEKVLKGKANCQLVKADGVKAAKEKKKAVAGFNDSARTQHIYWIGELNAGKCSSRADIL